MTPEMEAAIEEFLRERLEIRLELDRYGDYDGSGIEVTARLVLVKQDDPGQPWSGYTQSVIAQESARVRL